MLLIRRGMDKLSSLPSFAPIATPSGDVFSFGMTVISGFAEHMAEINSALGMSSTGYERLQIRANIADEVGIRNIGSTPIISGTYVRLVEGHFGDE